MTKQKESGEKKSRTRAFGSAFMLTLCLLILGCGFFVADINTRQMTFGNTEPRLEYAVENGEVVILRNGKRVARLISEDAAIGYLTDSLRGVLKHVPLEDDGRSARTEKYGLEEGAR